MLLPSTLSLPRSCLAVIACINEINAASLRANLRMSGHVSTTPRNGQSCGARCLAVRVIAAIEVKLEDWMSNKYDITCYHIS